MHHQRHPHLHAFVNAHKDHPVRLAVQATKARRDIPVNRANRVRLDSQDRVDHPASKDQRDHPDCRADLEKGSEKMGKKWKGELNKK